jgi:anti-anti-sigma factor
MYSTLSPPLALSEPIAPSDALVAHSTVSSDGLVVHLTGELDLANRESTASMCMSGLHGSVTVDLSGLTFMDSAGYSALEVARDAVLRRGGKFELTNVNGEPARLLAMIEHSRPIAS